MSTRTKPACTRCGHKSWDHGDRAVGICSGTYTCLDHPKIDRDGVMIRAAGNENCPCDGYTEKLPMIKITCSLARELSDKLNV